MNPENFLQSIYLGDRGCNKILVDNYNRIIKLNIDVISRIRSPSGKWDFYNDENIENGFIVFSSVKAMKWNSTGLLPNDFIKSIEVTKKLNDGYFEFSINIGANTNERSEDVEIIITAREIFIETKDGNKIYE